MSWYPIVGYGVFWISFIAAIIIYIITRKWYPIIYLISAALYIFTISFVIDVFDLGKNSILGILAFSAIFLIGLGYLISQKIDKA